MAGAEHTVGNEQGVSQPSTLMFDMANVDTARLKEYMDTHIHNLKGKEGYGGGGVWTDPEDSYDTPMRTLIPIRVNGLVMAARAISATHEAHGSLRTQGGAMGIGQAAGVLESQAALRDEQPREVPYAALKKCSSGRRHPCVATRREPRTRRNSPSTRHAKRWRRARSPGCTSPVARWWAQPCGTEARPSTTMGVPPLAGTHRH